MDFTRVSCNEIELCLYCIVCVSSTSCLSCSVPLVAQYSGAIVIRNRAERISDVDAESASDDKQSRHKRCRISRDDEVSEPPVHRTSKTKVALPSIPAGLRATALPHASKSTRLNVYSF